MKRKEKTKICEDYLWPFSFQMSRQPQSSVVHDSLWSSLARISPWHAMLFSRYFGSVWAADNGVWARWSLHTMRIFPFCSHFAIEGLIFGEKSRSRVCFSFEHQSAGCKKKGVLDSLCQRPNFMTRSESAWVCRLVSTLEKTRFRNRLLPIRL